MDIAKVACLYRVSLEDKNNDIPMQKNACHSFVKKNEGWHIVAEYYENGVSGYHKSIIQRDVLQKIRQDAIAKKFDILLVFMFDRLGRRDDETPFFVEWLHNQNIAVWSVMEGRQLISSQSDKLVNYIRFWQSAYESAQTGRRVSEKHRQMLQEGRYRGGPPPFGYRSENKKLHIHITEKMLIKTMYQLSNEGCGGYTIAKYLNDRQIQTRFQKRWTTPAVIRTLRNPIYKGVYGAVTFPDLMIVEEKIWNAANTAIDNRRKERKYKRRNAWLLGLVYCGYCGARLSVGNKGKRYDCPKKSQLNDCDGVYNYSAAWMENVVWTSVEPIINIQALYENEIKKLKSENEKIKRKIVHYFMGDGSNPLAALNTNESELRKAIWIKDHASSLVPIFIPSIINKVTVSRERVVIHIKTPPLS